MSEIFYLLKKENSGRQLVCFPYLGGYSAAFSDLAHNLKAEIEIWVANPPGHGSCTLKPVENLSELIDLYIAELTHKLKPGAVFFGHSMGGMVAYFVAKKMRDQGLPVQADILIMSACTSPSDFSGKFYSNLSDENLIQHMITYGGISNALLNEKNLLEHFLPAFRADFKILESASDVEIEPLGIPAYFLWGEKDFIVPISSILRWSKYFSQNITVHPVPEGEHMFIHNQANYVARKIEEILSGE